MVTGRMGRIYAIFDKVTRKKNSGKFCKNALYLPHPPPNDDFSLWRQSFLTGRANNEHNRNITMTEKKTTDDHAYHWSFYVIRLLILALFLSSCAPIPSRPDDMARRYNSLMLMNLGAQMMRDSGPRAVLPYPIYTPQNATCFDLGRGVVNCRQW